MSYGVDVGLSQSGGPINILQEEEPKTGTRFREIERILGIDSAFLVETLDEEITIGRFGDEIVASFPIKIEGKRFVVTITTKSKDLKDSVISGRQHPFLGYANGIHTGVPVSQFALLDFLPRNLEWNLVDENFSKLATNDAFWKEFRGRIRNGHPLSLNH